MTPNFRPCSYHGIKLEFGHLITEARIFALILTEIKVFTLEKIQIHRTRESKVNLIRDQYIAAGL